MISIKTQTKRTTKYQDGFINVNLFCGEIQIGIITSEGWGCFSHRAEPRIEIQGNGKSYTFSLSEFILKLEA